LSFRSHARPVAVLTLRRHGTFVEAAYEGGMVSHPTQGAAGPSDGLSPPTVSYANPTDPPIRRALIAAIERVSGQPRVSRLYHDYHLYGDKNRPFWGEALRRLEVTVTYDDDRLSEIPPTGPLVVVANHPFGVVDGLILCHLVSQVRSDFRIMAHEALYRAPEMRSALLPVSFLGPASRRTNIDSCRRAINHVRDGGAIVIFPAGRVSTALSVFGKAIDSPWQPFAAKLIATSKATVLPVFFEGQNSGLFHAASRISELCREALLISETLRRMGTTVRLHIGAPMPFRTLPAREDPQAMLAALMALTYCLPDSSGNDSMEPEMELDAGFAGEAFQRG